MFKRIRRFILLAIILGLLAFGAYKFFIDCDSINALFDREFTLKVMDYATISDDSNLTIKLLQIKDDRCTSEECEKSNELIAKVLVVNGSHLSTVKLSYSNPTVSIEKKKMQYTLTVTKITEGEVTLKVNK